MVKFQIKDIWAIGIILFGMIVGDLPFHGKNFHESTNSIMHDEYIIPHEIEESLSPEVYL